MYDWTLIGITAFILAAAIIGLLIGLALPRGPTLRTVLSNTPDLDTRFRLEIIDLLQERGYELLSNTTGPKDELILTLKDRHEQKIGAFILPGDLPVDFKQMDNILLLMMFSNMPHAFVFTQGTFSRAARERVIGHPLILMGENEILRWIW